MEHDYTENEKGVLGMSVTDDRLIKLIDYVYQEFQVDNINVNADFVDDISDSLKELQLLRTELEEWKKNAMRLAALVEEQRNAYDIMGFDGVTGITDEGYIKLERALSKHNSLVEKEGKE